MSLKPSLSRIYWFTFQYGATYTDLKTVKKYRVIFIYIPIWSYLYYMRGLWIIYMNSIYIPIWSYLYIKREIPQLFNIIFTFQYGATYTEFKILL